MQNHFFRCASDASVPCIGDENVARITEMIREPNQTTRRSAVWCCGVLLYSRSSSSSNIINNENIKYVLYIIRIKK